MAEWEPLQRVVRRQVDAQPALPQGVGGLVGWLRRMCAAAAQSVPASGVGVSVMAPDGATAVTAASDADSERLEELEITLGEGPSRDAFAQRRPVLEPDLAGRALRRWPAYSPAALDQGIRSVFALPLQVGGVRLGVLVVYRQTAAPLSREALALALTYAEVTVQRLLDERSGLAGAERTEALDEALGYRVELYQAQGMVMIDLDVSLSVAMARLRAYAYARERRLSDVARDVVAGSLRLEADP